MKMSNIIKYQISQANMKYIKYLRPNTFPPRIEKSDRHYGVANGDDLTYLFPVLQVHLQHHHHYLGPCDCLGKTFKNTFVFFTHFMTKDDRDT